MEQGFVMIKRQISGCFRFASIAVVLLIICFNVFSTIAYASEIDSFLTDGYTRWTHYSSDYSSVHMGTKNTTYSYSSSTVKSNYSSYVISGIGLWGSNIYCIESSSSPMGTITVSAMDSGANAETYLNYNTSSNHVTSWYMTIYSTNFDVNSDPGKYRTIAHEIGHVYGLGHVSYNSQIMYHTYNESKSVTSYDIAGMNVMTHTHTHIGSYSITLEQYSTYTHKVRCATCKAYYLSNCSYTDYHSGSRHYLVINCNCGNNTTQSWICSGNPCVMPFSYEPPQETQ